MPELTARLKVGAEEPPRRELFRCDRSPFWVTVDEPNPTEARLAVHFPGNISSSSLALQFPTPDYIGGPFIMDPLYTGRLIGERVERFMDL
eukprot:5341098-Pleurochrysis_carterae.AAC.8